MNTPQADIYFNLTRHVWSVRDCATGVVARHARMVIFPHGARFVVRPAGRARVIREGVKNVHAFVRGSNGSYQNAVGDWDTWRGLEASALVKVTYNPFRAPYFTEVESGKRIDESAVVLMLAPESGPPTVWAAP